MEITFKSKITDQDQTINLTSNVTTFIGGNGSGKSSILESIFQKYIEDDDARVICFSSGQNELFSEIFQLHRKQNKRYQTKDDKPITSFYFNSDWVRLLVFWASSFKTHGLVRKYLLDNNYIETNDLGDDITSQLWARFRIRKYYVNKIKQEAEKEELGDVEYDENGIAKNLESFTRFHQTLEKITFNNNINFDFRNSENLRKTFVPFNSSNIYDIFSSKNVNELFSFWAHATNGYQANFDLSDIQLKFKDGKEFKYLSDGEYQLLAIYAIIDLFDNEETLFLLDEIDSHLYYENLSKMWDSLKNVEGKVLTTTHISDSILKNDIDGIKLIDKGQIVEDLTFLALSKRLSSMLGKKNYRFEILSRVKNAVIIDDQIDWKIFLSLAQKKLGSSYDSKIEKVVPIKIPSGYSRDNKVLGKQKLLFTEDFKRRIDQGRNCITENIFLICDLDDFNRSKVQSDLSVNFTDTYKPLKKFNSNKTLTHLLAWKRREIENYLLSITLLENKNKLSQLQNQLKHLNLTKGDSLDTMMDIANYDAKELIHPIYKDPQLNEELFSNMISEIPPEEISEDIKLMYDFILGKM